MNGATQKVEQLESDRLTVTELIQVKRNFLSIKNYCYNLANNGFNY